MTGGAAAGTDRIRVLVVDDDPLARQAIATILSADPGLQVSGEADDGEAACALADQGAADVILMDIRMPGTTGLAALRRLSREHPELPVIMLTTFSDHGAIREALAGGAAGFLLKTAAPDELTRAIRAALEGGLVMSPSVSRWVVEHWVSDRADASSDRGRLDALTARQSDVLHALSEGDSNAEIGRRLHLSEGTVKGYVSEIIAALRVRNRVEAAVLAHRLRPPR